MSTPLGKTAWGFLLAALDLRINDVDLLPDPVGWVLAAIGLWGLADHSLGFRIGALLAGVDAVVSLPLVVRAEIPAPLSSLDVLLQTGFLFAVCTGLIATLAHRPDKAGSANVIRWLDLGLTVLLAPSLLLVGGAAQDLAFLGPLALMLALVGLVVAVWFVVLLFQVRNDPAVGGRPAATP